MSDMITTVDRSVPFFRYPHLYMEHREELLQLIDGICSRGAFILQPEVTSFEKELARYAGSAFAVGVGNATDGLVLGLEAAEIGHGDEVIFSSHTFVATAAAIHQAGATPVPVECGPDHLMDPAAAEAAVTSRTRAIMPTQLNGRVCDMDTLQAVADRHGLVIVEDSAQALGAKYKGQGAGTFGHFGSFSFYPAKSLGCFGDGGAITTNDEHLHDLLRLIHNHGRLPTGQVVRWGHNSRLDNLQAAILSFKLVHFDCEIEKRRQIARWYETRLADVAELRLPPGPDSDPERFDTFQNYELEADRRDDLSAHLSERGVGTLVQWGGWAVHQFSALGLNADLPFTEGLFKRLLMLPMNTSLDEDDVDYVAAQIRSFYGYSTT